MFELARLGGTPEKGIVVQTVMGTSIPNDQAPTPDSRSVAAYRRLLRKHPKWRERRSPIGRYNCFGHIWASRRTAIREDSAVDLILREDGYRRLRDGEEVAVGDLALYVVTGAVGARKYLHVGRVCELLQADGFVGTVPRILSKWNDCAGEVVHASKDVSWSEDLYELEFWTDRAVGDAWWNRSRV